MRSPILRKCNPASASRRERLLERRKATASGLRSADDSRGSLVLEPSALWIENTRLKFYAPQNAEHVSHSIVNLHNSSSANAGHIEVSAMTLESLIEKHRLGAIPLMKLDIEGAEGKVIESALEKRIYPRQLLVEFDEMNLPSDRSKNNDGRYGSAIAASRICVPLFRRDIQFSLYPQLARRNQPIGSFTVISAPQ